MRAAGRYIILFITGSVLMLLLAGCIRKPKDNAWIDPLVEPADSLRLAVNDWRE